jgi:ribosomal protein L18E
MRARANADAIKVISDAILNGGASGKEAVNLNVAEKYIDAWGHIAKEGNTIVVPANIADVSGMIAQAMTVMKGVASGGTNASSSSGIKIPASTSHIKIN